MIYIKYNTCVENNLGNQPQCPKLGHVKYTLLMISKSCMCSEFNVFIEKLKVDTNQK